MNEVTVDDVKASENGGGNESRLTELEGLSQVDLQKKIMEDPELYKLILQETENVIESKTNARQLPNESSEPQVVAKEQSQSASDTMPGEESDVSVSIKPSWLGTYGKNRTPSEAIQELVKGVGEKDKTINFFKTHKLPALESEIESTKQQLHNILVEMEELKKQKVEPPKQVSATDDNVTIDDIDIPEDFDQFDPDHIGSLVKAFKNLTTNYKQLESKVKTQSQGQSQSASEAKPQTPQATASADSEFKHIDALVANPEYSEFFNTNRSVQAIEGDYVEFVKNMAAVHGVHGVIIDEKGRFTDSALKLIRAYSDDASPESATVRNLCEQNNIKPPVDMPALNLVYKVRGIRAQYSKKNGAGLDEPISWEDAFSMVAIKDPAISTAAKMREKLAEHEAMSRAQANRKSYSVEPKSTDGGDMSDINNMPMSQLEMLMKKNSSTYTPEEKALVSRFLKEKANMNDAEITAWFTPVRR